MGLGLALTRGLVELHGGQIVAQGPPELVARNAESVTGRYLAEALAQDVDLRIKPNDEDSPATPDEVESGSTARVKISKLGRSVEYNWSDFKRVTPFAGN